MQHTIQGIGLFLEEELDKTVIYQPTCQITYDLGPLVACGLVD